MLSEETQRHIEELIAAQPTYKPSQTVLSQLQHIIFICFVGAASMGKTTVMDSLVALDPEHFGKTRNFTTRPPRPDDDPNRYYYFEHSDSGLAPIFDRIRTRELLQYNIDPFSRYLYGSEVEGYTHTYSLGDIWSTSIDGFRQLGFGKLYVCSIVTEPAAWLRRFNERFPVGNPLREARLKEAAVSLEWSLAQTETDHCLIINHDGNPDAAAQQVMQMLGGNPPAQAAARALATECLAAIRRMNV